MFHAHVHVCMAEPLNCSVAGWPRRCAYMMVEFGSTTVMPSGPSIRSKSHVTALITIAERQFEVWAPQWGPRIVWEGPAGYPPNGCSWAQVRTMKIIQQDEILAKLMPSASSTNLQSAEHNSCMANGQTPGSSSLQIILPASFPIVFLRIKNFF